MYYGEQRKPSTRVISSLLLPQMGLDTKCLSAIKVKLTLCPALSCQSGKNN